MSGSPNCILRYKFHIFLQEIILPAFLYPLEFMEEVQHLNLVSYSLKKRKEAILKTNNLTDSKQTLFNTSGYHDTSTDKVVQKRDTMNSWKESHGIKRGLQIAAEFSVTAKS